MHTCAVQAHCVLVCVLIAFEVPCQSVVRWLGIFYQPVSLSHCTIKEAWLYFNDSYTPLTQTCILRTSLNGTASQGLKYSIHDNDDIIIQNTNART